MKHPIVLLFAVALMEFVASGCVTEDLTQKEIANHSEQAIVNGVLDSSHHQVVEVFLSSGGECTGTLITSRTVLTAAHCLVNVSTVTIAGEELQWDPEFKRWGWGGYELNGTSVIAGDSDVALVNLPRDVGNGVIPAGIGTQVAAGMPITLVGYGESAAGVGDSGFRRSATNTIDSFDATQFYFNGTTGAEGATCFGDSGGPAFRSGSTCIVGITHGQLSAPFCNQAGGAFYDARVDPRIIWIQANAIGTIQTCTP